MKTLTGLQSLIRIVFLLGSVVSAMAGCGGKTGSGGTGGTGGKGASDDGGVMPTVEDQAFIASLCTAAMPCCATHALTANATACGQSLGKVGLSRDPQLRAACLDEVHQRAASPACMPDIVDFVDPCTRLFNEPSGTRAPGESCARTAECAGSPGTITKCDASTCISYAVGAEGDYPCLGNEFSNGAIDVIPWKNGSTTPESHAFVCQKRVGLYCDLSDNKCKRLQPGGQACTTSEGCDSRWCENGAGTCLPLPALGEQCTVSCAGDSTCDRAVCVPKLVDGAACDVTKPDECLGDCHGSNLCSGSCEYGVCSPLNLAESAMLDVWCGRTPFNG